MAELSKKHGMEMLEQGDQSHIEAMEKMKGLMNDPEAMKACFDTMRKMFDSLSEN